MSDRDPLPLPGERRLVPPSEWTVAEAAFVLAAVWYRPFDVMSAIGGIWAVMILVWRLSTRRR